MYTLEIYTNKKYKAVYTGRMSQCFKRSNYRKTRQRIKKDGKVIWQHG